MNKYLININDLLIGDVLLFSDNDLTGKAIKHFTKSNYVHAAIYLGDNYVAESMVKGNRGKNKLEAKVGMIQKESLDVVIKRYDYIAVLRSHPSAGWNFDSRKTLLKEFVENLIENNASYNAFGAVNLVMKNKTSNALADQNVKDYFEGKKNAPSPIKDKYFCSEFIVDCYKYGGILSESTSFHIIPEEHSPGDLASSNNFGYLLGYIICKDGFIIPESDDLYHSPTYDQIMNS